MARPSLLIMSFSPLLSDARVLKQIRLFTPQYDVTTVGYGAAPEGVVEHLQIPDELVYWQYPRPLVMARLFERAYWANPVVSWLAPRLEKGRYDVVLADDIDPVPLAMSLGARRGVHVDLHEYAPRMKEDLTRWRWFVAPFVRWMCARYVTQADSVTTVGQGIAREYEREFDITAQVVTNATPYTDLQPQPTSSPIRLVHSGAARPDRHLELMIDAARLTSREVTLDFFLTPNDPAYLERLMASVADDDRITIHPPVPYTELVTAIARYDVGVFVLPPVNFNYRWALPNKVFDFVQARLALLVSPSPEMAAVVRSHHLGVVTTDFTAESMAHSLDALTDEDVDRYKAASHQAARELSAESQVAIWDAAVRTLVERSA